MKLQRAYNNKTLKGYNSGAVIVALDYLAQIVTKCNEMVILGYRQCKLGARNQDIKYTK